MEGGTSMFLDNPINLGNLLSSLGFVFNIGFLAFAVIYFIFSLIVIRQVSLMSQTVITEGSIILKFIAIIHALLALGIVILFISFF